MRHDIAMTKVRESERTRLFSGWMEFKPVATSPNGEKMPWLLWILFIELAKAEDEIVNCSRRGHNVHSPNLFQDIGPREDLAGMPGQEQEQSGLLVGEIHCTQVGFRNSCRGIDFVPPDHQGFA